jgi:ribosomal protein S1
VTDVVSFGAFVGVDGGVEGLVHVSEMLDGFSPEQAVSKGERVLVRVLRVDAARRWMGLSLRDVSVGESEEWMGQEDEIPEAPPEGGIDLSATVKQECEVEGEWEGSEVAPSVGYATSDRTWDRLFPSIASSTMGRR